MKLVYFNVHGRVQPIRLLLSLAEVKYEEEIINIGAFVADWPTIRQAYPFGSLPVLVTDDGEMFPQAVAISNHVASMHGLKGATDRDRLVSTVIAESCNETIDASYQKLHQYLVYMSGSTPGEETLMENRKAITDKWMKLCELVEKYQSAKYPNSSFINGEKVTEADAWLWNLAEYIRQALPDLQCSDWYKRLEANVLSDEGVKKYLANRPESAF